MGIETELNNKKESSETWNKAKSRKRKQSSMDVESVKNPRPHFPPAKRAMLVYVHLFLI